MIQMPIVENPRPRVILVLCPRDSVRLHTRSLTLGALIGAPTVREGLPSIAQYHTVGDLVP